MDIHACYGRLTVVKKGIRWLVSPDCIAGDMFFKLSADQLIDCMLRSIMKRPYNKQLINLSLSGIIPALMYWPHSQLISGVNIIVLSCFYQLILYFEKFSTKSDVCCLPYYMTLNLSDIKRPLDSKTSMKNEIFLIPSSACAWTSVILAGKHDSHSHSITSFSKNVIETERSLQLLEFLSFCQWERA